MEEVKSKGTREKDSFKKSSRQKIYKIKGKLFISYIKVGFTILISCNE
jgi:hypothetical protein